MAISAEAKVQRSENIVHVEISYPLAPMPWTVFLPPLFLFFPLLTFSFFNSLASMSPLYAHYNFSGEHFSEATLQVLKDKIRTVFRLNTFEKYLDQIL